MKIKLGVKEFSLDAMDRDTIVNALGMMIARYSMLLMELEVSRSKQSGDERLEIVETMLRIERERERGQNLIYSMCKGD